VTGLHLRWLAAPIHEATYAAVHDVVAAVAAGQGAVGWLEVPDRPEVDAWLDRALPTARMVAAYARSPSEGGRLVGLGYWARLEYPVLSGNAEVRKVMTHPDVRGRGVARAVTTALVENARAAGVEVLTLDCRGNNHAALALYADLGFVTTGRRPDFIAVGDERFDQVLLHLDLRTGPGATVRHGGRREGPGST
jgi:ribosomal protein S18 acetylase RimI-like enzyme